MSTAPHFSPKVLPNSWRIDEFSPDASVWPADLSRRRFIQLMGASLALAGLSGCNRQPRKEIVPFVTPPEAGFDLEKLYYASAFSFEGFARGTLVEAHSGRPTKIEGNPLHPDSLGATDVFMQASVLDLYDPDRSRTPLHEQVPNTWNAFEDEWAKARTNFLGNGGNGLALLTEPTTSPTLLAQIHAWLDAFPKARWYQHTALSRYDRGGRQVDFDLEKTDVILAIDCDLFSLHPSAIRYMRAYGKRRKIREGRANPHRIYALESSFTILGSNADVRLAVDPARRPVILNALTRRLQNAGRGAGEPLTAEENRFVTALTNDLRQHAPRVACAVGPDLDDPIHDWAEALHGHLGAFGQTVFLRPAPRSDGDPRAAGGLPHLVEAIDAGEIDSLFIIDSNPAYTAPADLEFAARLRRVPHAVHLGRHVDETATLCPWHLPLSHALESWGDLRSFDGTASIVQPLIEPMYASRSAIEFMRGLTGETGADGYELVRRTWRTKGQADFESSWRQWLDRGVIDGTTANPIQPGAAADFPELPASDDAHRSPLILQFAPDSSVSDGRGANNPWLQELPRPFTHLVWDNAALISASLAEKLKVQNGDVLRLRTTSGTLEVPGWIAQGQAPSVVTLHLGYGRGAGGDVGKGVGANAYVLRSHTSPAYAPLLECAKTGGRRPLVSTHGHFSLEGRDLARTVEVRALGQVHGEPPPARSLYPEVEYKGYAWAMAIDLGACTGCNACVVACQAENNIPSVGREQVDRGREMHWLRIDRYYSGPAENPRALHQPVPCMQCEHAPCELVCPVAATVHSSEGLNDMVYNRCVGTRYCSNNCPYKVRHFNFLDFRAPPGSTTELQANPNVTVRERGVMEKCTYCVQRINAGRIQAEKENRKVRDGEILTACQQACPAEAIIFGDLSDPQSRVNQWKHEPTNYALLAELNTRPRTTYLARILNSPEVNS